MLDSIIVKWKTKYFLIHYLKKPFFKQVYQKMLNFEYNLIVLKILLLSIEALAKTGTTDIVVVDTLHQSRIWHMILVDRRRLIQILSFTIKEFRELTKLTGLQSMLNKEDFNWIDQNILNKLKVFISNI